MFATPLRSLVAFKSLAESVRRHLPEIRQPTLIIHPREDDMASLANAHEIAANLGGLVDTLVLDDSYHLVTLDRQRRLVCERVVAFAARFARPAPQARATRRPDPGQVATYS
jgi:carboxylesterase